MEDYCPIETISKNQIQPIFPNKYNYVSRGRRLLSGQSTQSRMAPNMCTRQPRNWRMPQRCRRLLLAQLRCSGKLPARWTLAAYWRKLSRMSWEMILSLAYFLAQKPAAVMVRGLQRVPQSPEWRRNKAPARIRASPSHGAKRPKRLFQRLDAQPCRGGLLLLRHHKRLLLLKAELVCPLRAQLRQREAAPNKPWHSLREAKQAPWVLQTCLAFSRCRRSWFYRSGIAHARYGQGLLQDKLMPTRFSRQSTAS